MMKNHSTLQRGLAAFSTVLAVLMFAPAAFAANSLVLNLTVTPDPFNIKVPGHMEDAKVFVAYNWNAGGYTTGDVTEVIKDSNGNVVYYWGATEGADPRATVAAITNEMLLEWNGKANTGALNGQYVPDGNYTFYVLSHVATAPDTEASKTFKLQTTVPPTLTWVTQPAAQYYLSSGNYPMNFNYVGNSAQSSVVNVTISGPANDPKSRVLSLNLNSNGNSSFSWDGKINGVNVVPGVYTYSMVANASIDGFGSLGTPLTGSVTVGETAPSPMVSGLSATPNPFNAGNGNMTLAYTLAGSTGSSSITAGVYAQNDTSVPLKSWTFASQSNGSNSISWDGKNTLGNLVADGSYIFKVSGNDGSFIIVPVQTSFSVAAVVSTKCAGFTDLNQSDSDCDAFQYVKDLGAMTGNPDGTFGAEDTLQRDQVAKIVLVTFKKYDNGSNYCNGNNPFPDVTSNSWAFQYICRGVALSLITGYQGGADAGYYRPARAVNRVEFLALLLRNLSDSMPANSSSSYADVAVGQWFSGYAKYSKDHGLFSGGNLYPTSSTTRREVAEVIFKLHQQGKI